MTKEEYEKQKKEDGESLIQAMHDVHKSLEKNKDEQEYENHLSKSAKEWDSALRELAEDRKRRRESKSMIQPGQKLKEGIYINYILLEPLTHRVTRKTYALNDVEEKGIKNLFDTDMYFIVYKYATDEIPIPSDEYFVPVFGYGLKYLISDKGNVKALKVSVKNGARYVDRKNQISKQNGYYYIGLTDDYGNYKNCSVHRLVLLSFAPLPNNYKSLDCMHLDHKRDNPNIENLRWGTRKENELAKMQAGRHNAAKGEGASNTKLTSKDVLIIRKLISKKVSNSCIGRLFGVTNMCIKDIKNGVTWKHI